MGKIRTQAICIEEGCGNKVYCRDYCIRHYKKFIENPKNKEKKRLAKEKDKIRKQGITEEKKNSKLPQMNPAPISKFKTTDMGQLRKEFLKPCSTQGELKRFIKYFFELDLPDCKVSRFSDISPFHAVWEPYDICVNKHNPHNITELLFVAGRGTGKCQHYQTQILTKNGPKQIKDIQKGDVVFTGWCWDKVKEVYNEGVKDSIRIKTKTTTGLSPFDNIGSPHHRIQAMDEHGNIGWCQLDSLRIGQYVYKSSYCDFKINTSSNDYLDGWLIGIISGNDQIFINDDSIIFGNTSNELLMPYIRQANIHGNMCRQETIENGELVNIIAVGDGFCNWVRQNIDIDKKLITLTHSVDFLAGFMAGVLESNQCVSSIYLKNEKLIIQLGQVFNIFGVASSIGKKSNTEWECIFKSRLPSYFLPLFSNKEILNDFINNIKETDRYPIKVIFPFVRFLKEKLHLNHLGRVKLEKKGRSITVPFGYFLFDCEKSKDEFIDSKKILDLCKFMYDNDLIKQMNMLDFILNGYFEKVISIEKAQNYFYDLEMEHIHSYWSNAFISHNTLGMAIAELLMIFHDQRDAVHVGGILAQAKRCYAYQKKFLLSDKIRPIVYPTDLPNRDKLVQSSTMEKTMFFVNSEQVTLEVIPCTLKACNGPHVPFVVCDEIDTISGEGSVAYKEISGMLDPRKGKQPFRVGISSFKLRNGLVNETIVNAVEQDVTVKRWTVLEFTQRCEDDRSGRIPTQYYVNTMEWDIKTLEDFEKSSMPSKKSYTLENMWNKCIKCKIAPVCLGDLKNQNCKSSMLKTVDSVIKQVSKEGINWSLSQLMSLKPEQKGAVFPQFDEKIHVKSWNEMWEILTGYTYPGDCDHDVFIQKCHELKLIFMAGVDWGWSCPSTMVVLCVDKRENVYIVGAYGDTHRTRAEWRYIMKNKYQPIYKCQLYWPDLADPSVIKEMNMDGLIVGNSALAKDSISVGVGLISKLLKLPGLSQPKIFFANETCRGVNKNTMGLIEELHNYSYRVGPDGKMTDDYSDDNNHYIDALRYVLTGAISGGKSNLCDLGFLGKNELMNSRGELLRSDMSVHDIPSLVQENIIIKEVPENTEPKIGTLRELAESKKKDPSNGGNGGFWFSF